MCYIGPYSTYSKEPGESGCSVACLVRYSTYSTYSKEPGESGCSVACLVRYSTYSTYSKDPGESGCSVACLVRYSTYSTYSKGPGDCEGSAWCRAWHRSSRPRPDTPARQVIRIIRIIRSYGHTAAWHCAGHRIAPSILAWAQDCPKNPSPGHRRRCVGDAVLAASLTVCFFHHSHAQPSILASWRGHRIAPVFPRKRWKRSAVQHYAPRLAARIARKTPAVRRYTPMHSRTRRPDARKTTEAHCCIAGRSRKTPPASCCVAVH